MKLLHAFFVLFATINTTFAQTNYMNSIWIGGYVYLDPYGTQYQLSMMKHSPTDFIATTDTVPIALLEIYDEVDHLLGNAVFCNAFGDLLLYTNGCKIYGANHLPIPETEAYAQDDAVCYEGQDSYPGFFLPLNDSIVDLIRGNSDGLSISRSRFKIKVSGEIEFLFFNEPFYTFSSEIEAPSAVRHGNGKDWWIHCGKPNLQDSTDGYEYMFLLTEAGITDTIEYATNFSGLGIVQTTFSPDGQWMVRQSVYTSLQLSRIDRCTGLIYNTILLDVPDHYNFINKSAAFTADSRFVYGCNFDSLWRFDVAAVDINASREFVATHDGDYSEFENDSTSFEGTHLALMFRNSFHQCRLGRNGVMYIDQGYCNSRYFHLINNPSAPIEEIDFQIRGVDLQNSYGCHLPLVVEYELRDSPNSPCDTLKIDGGLGVYVPTVIDVVSSTEEANTFVNISPNPASNTFLCQTEGKTIQSAQLFTAQGVLVAEQNLLQPKNEVQFDVAALIAGLYFVQLKSTSGFRFTSTVLIAH